MKNVIITLTLLLFSIVCFSQTKSSYTLKEYIHKHKLNSVIDVESNKELLVLSGYNKGNDSILVVKKVRLARFDILAIYHRSWFYSNGHFNLLPISITTVPFKVRPSLAEFKTNASSGITNFGVNLDFARWQIERYFINGKKTFHKLYAGVWIAPSVVELDSIYTRGYIPKGMKSKQLFISTALTFNYTYNNLTFTFVPIGYDFATSPTGNNWIYNKERWWGFGIGLEPKFLNK